MHNLYDTSVIIEHIRGNNAVSTYLSQQELYCSVITGGELIQGVQNKHDQRVVEKILARMTMLPLTPAIGECMVDFIKAFHLSQGLAIPDALIAATAIEHDLVLVTHNTKHFSFIPKLSVRSWKEAVGEMVG